MTSMLVAGLHRTGTTGVYSAVRDALDEDAAHLFLFEPREPDQLLAPGRYAPDRPLVAKILVHRLDDCEVRYDDFDRRVMMVRDPRDVAISRLLFRPMFGWTSYHLDVTKLDPFVAALREKEADPSSWSVKGLHELADRIGISSSMWPRLVDQMERKAEIIAEHDFFTLRYEDFVDGDLDAVSDYLGLRLTNPRAPSNEYQRHVRRSLAHGNWRHWFTADDVEFFNELFADELTRHGYGTDWELADEPHIDPATSSGHVDGTTRERIVARQDERARPWRAADVGDDEVAELRARALDGGGTSAYRLALVRTKGKRQLRDRDQALHWAHHAAVLGHTPAMALLARLRERKDPARDDVLAARFWRREHDQRKAHEEHIRELEAQIAHLRSSTRYRVGTALARIARDPLAQALPTLRRLLRLVRRWRRRDMPPGT